VRSKTQISYACSVVSIWRQSALLDAPGSASYKRLLEVEIQLRAEVEELFTLSEQIDQREVPDGLVVHDEIARREDRLARLAEAKVALETRAQERAAQEQALYETMMVQRAERERATGRRLCLDPVTATSTTSPTRSSTS